jgi:hypothetical protein
MGAFDAYIPATYYDNANAIKHNNNKFRYTYFYPQSGFSFYEGFGIDELKELLLEAEKENKESVYIWLDVDRTRGQCRVDTWYLRALIEHYDIIEG